MPRLLDQYFDHAGSAGSRRWRRLRAAGGGVNLIARAAAHVVIQAVFAICRAGIGRPNTMACTIPAWC